MSLDIELPAGMAIMADVSTAHLNLAGEDGKILDYLARYRTRTESCPRVVNHEYGWLLYLSGDKESQAEEIKALSGNGVSEGLLEMVSYAHLHGAYVLNLDSDADVIQGFIHY